MEQHLLLGKPDGTYRQGHAGQQIKPLRDHADHRRNHGSDTVPEGLVVKEKALGKQDASDGDQRNTHEFHQLVQGADHLRLLSLLDGFRLQGQLGDIGIRAHLLQPGPAFSGHHKASRHQMISGLLHDLVRFTGEQRLIDPHLAEYHLSVRADLVACLEDHNVIQHQIFRIDRCDLPFPHHQGMRGVQHIQLLQHMLGPDLLDDTNKRIDDDHRHESQVPEGAHQAQQHCQHGKDQVEVGKYIFMDDLFHRLGRRIHRDIGPPGRHTLRRLGPGQTLLVIRLVPGHRSSLNLITFWFLLLCSSKASPHVCSSFGDVLSSHANHYTPKSWQIL